MGAGTAADAGGAEALMVARQREYEAAFENGYADLVVRGFIPLPTSSQSPLAPASGGTGGAPSGARKIPSDHVFYRIMLIAVRTRRSGVERTEDAETVACCSIPVASSVPGLAEPGRLFSALQCVRILRDMAS